MCCRKCGAVFRSSNTLYLPSSEQMKSAWFLVFCFSSWTCVSLQSEPVVQTRSGPIQGKEYAIPGASPVISYSGIPYAEPPVGPLRFSPPEPVRSWTGVLQATGSTTPCIQQAIGGLAYHNESPEKVSEDCLKLNIIVPSPTPANAPVLVYIHGGAFSVGSAIRRVQFAANLVNEENIIVVSMNYRLNVFGFASLGIPEAPGNMALMDQHLAMEWIKDNIDAFGGDSNRITIMGMSAGSSAVTYHLLSNKDPGLFHRAIMMSGAVGDTVHAEPEHIVSKTRKLAGLVGCSSENATSVLDCLRGVSPRDLLRAEPATRLVPNDMFRPSVDGIYVTEHPEVSILAGRFSPVPVLVGVVSKEGSRFAMGFNRDLFTDEISALSSNDLETTLKRLLGPDASPLILEGTLLFYKNFTAFDDELENRNSAVRAYGDRIFVCSVNSFCEGYAAAGGTVYKYLYDQRRVGPGSSDWMEPDHASDLSVVVGFPISDGHSSEEDVAFSRKLMRQWAAFVRTGDPNVAGDGSPEWPRFNVAHRPHMRLSQHPQVEHHYRVKECSFWDNLLPSLRTVRNC